MLFFKMYIKVGDDLNDKFALTDSFRTWDPVKSEITLRAVRNSSTPPFRKQLNIKFIL